MSIPSDCFDGINFPNSHFLSFLLKMIAFTIPLLISLMLVRSEEIVYVSQPIGGWINYTSVQMNPAENNTYLIVIDNNTTLFTLDVFLCQSLNVTENTTICTVEIPHLCNLGISRTVSHH